MEQIKLKIKHTPLKQVFIYMVLCTVLIILLLSGLTIWGCAAFQSWLLPDSDQVILYITNIYADGTEEQQSIIMEMNQPEQVLPVLMEESFPEEPITGTGNPASSASTSNSENHTQEVNRTFRIDKIENSYSALTPKRKLAYTGCSVLMVALPLLYSTIGILLCAIYFYKWKLTQPLHLLTDAAGNITKQNLDFSITYDSSDEMGSLCAAFENMRKALVENYQELWKLLEERKLLQASVAHDLRNPIAIIEGYTEYLSLNLPAGTVSQERLLEIISNLQDTAKRMEVYTDSIRDINRLEELTLQPVCLSLPELSEEIINTFTLMAEQKKKTIILKNRIANGKAILDKQIYYRILENMFSNALRYAKDTIALSFALEGDAFITTISDDGPGFPEKLLSMKNHRLPTMNTSTEHLGMGIPVSHILCKKHGGELSLSNQPSGGAEARIVIVID